MIKVLFVCMGNICRSPTAEGVFIDKLANAGLQDGVEVDSAGTHAYHVGHPPDVRAQEAALKRGIDISSQVARRVVEQDFEQFDYVLAMDLDNLEILETICPTQYRQRLNLFLKFAPQLPENEVPDPYYGGAKGFDRVLDLIEAASDGLISHIRKTS
ncbi:MAG: low molecular weight protein-tyrosine-phosphatase [Gammaproteobacteria bacterium]